METQTNANWQKILLILLLFMNVGVLIVFRLVYYNSDFIEPSKYLLLLTNSITFGILFSFWKANLWNFMALIGNVFIEYLNHFLEITK